MKTEQRKTLCKWLEKEGISFLENAPMRDYTTFRVGGPADILLHPGSAEQIQLCLRACRELSIPLTLLGNGSNTLVRDGGIRGAVLRLGPDLPRFR